MHDLVDGDGDILDLSLLLHLGLQLDVVHVEPREVVFEEFGVNDLFIL